MSTTAVPDPNAPNPNAPDPNAPNPPDPNAPAPTPSTRISGAEVLNTEFVYYSAVLKTYTPNMSRETDRTTVHQWMKKLFGPIYHSSALKPKRNKYLLYLTITIYNDETYGIFKQEPPNGVLANYSDITFNKDLPQAAWETETQWADTLCDLPADTKFTDCYLHAPTCPTFPTDYGSLLDSQFQFYLWISRPYIALIQEPEEKTMVACWVRQLCGIAPESGNCPAMKELRNDYMQALIGYVNDLRVEGPFRRMPPMGPVPPLSLWYDQCKADLDDPLEKEKEKFLASLPLPETGAFAYINVTGEIFGEEL